MAFLSQSWKQFMYFRHEIPILNMSKWNINQMSLHKSLTLVHKLSWMLSRPQFAVVGKLSLIVRSNYVVFNIKSNKTLQPHLSREEQQHEKLYLILSQYRIPFLPALSSHCHHRQFFITLALTHVQKSIYITSCS